jgi:superfamily II DNA/RNA helicase
MNIICVPGKTLAFALPALVHIQKQSVRNEDGPVVLVLCPTRELTQQVAQVFFHYAQVNNKQNKTSLQKKNSRERERTRTRKSNVFILCLFVCLL